MHSHSGRGGWGWGWGCGCEWRMRTKRWRTGIQLELQEQFMQMPQLASTRLAPTRLGLDVCALRLAKMEYFSHVNSFTFNSRIKFVTYFVLIMHANLLPLRLYPQQVSPLSVRFTSDGQAFSRWFIRIPDPVLDPVQSQRALCGSLCLNDLISRILPIPPAAAAAVPPEHRK